MKPKCLLIVDDSAADRYLAIAAIEDFDDSIEVLQAVDGKEALETLATAANRVDLVFLDINMPVMDGIEFLERYGQVETPCATVVMLSSSHQQADKDRCMKYDFVIDYLTKPLTADDLTALVGGA